MMMKLMLSVAALVAIASAQATCQNNGDCNNTACTFCQGGGGSAPTGTCVDGRKCGTACGVATDCSSSCSVCAIFGNATQPTCQPACNQTCSTSSDCNGAGNGGCGNCVNGVCSLGKFCGDTCAADAECGTYAFPYCTMCVSGKCNGGCGTACMGDGVCNGNSTCPRCSFKVCGAAASCGDACMVDQDCGLRGTSPCWACQHGVCTKPPL